MKGLHIGHKILEFSTRIKVKSERFCILQSLMCLHAEPKDNFTLYYTEQTGNGAGIA